jgi:hypothetical protein
VQRGQQAQAVQAQVGLFRIDHHAVEEGVDRPRSAASVCSEPV